MFLTFLGSVERNDQNKACDFVVASQCRSSKEMKMYILRTL